MLRAHRSMIRIFRSRSDVFVAILCFHSMLLAVFSAQESEPDETGVRDFASGVRIDWTQHAVEADSRVVLREGPLELFACSPQTKEHESVLTVLARPLHLFQAMGLVGLEAGSPARYDEKLDRWFPASGEPLDLRIRWREGGKERLAAPRDWMVEKSAGKAPQRLRWVFAGSLVRKEGGFGADADGTVACLVDFDSALIALSASHSSDDAELWLSANPKEVPPSGTRCTLIIRSAYHPKVEVEIASGAVLRVDGKPLTAAQIGDLLVETRDERTPFLSARHLPALPESDLTKAVQELKEELRRRKLDPDVSMSMRLKKNEKKPENTRKE